MIFIETAKFLKRIAEAKRPENLDEIGRILLAATILRDAKIIKEAWNTRVSEVGTRDISGIVVKEHLEQQEHLSMHILVFIYRYLIGKNPLPKAL